MLHSQTLEFQIVILRGNDILTCLCFFIVYEKFSLSHTAWSVTYKWADCLWLNNGSLFLTALSVFLMPVIRLNYSLLVLVCAVFGLCAGKGSFISFVQHIPSAQYDKIASVIIMVMTVMII